MIKCNNNSACGNLVEPQRNNYFYGKLLDETNLRLEQTYLNQKRWMLNRLSLGTGVLCGLTVSYTEDRVCISAGVAIDGCGREVVVPEPIPVDPWQTTDDCGSPTTRLPVGGAHEVYICLTYIECLTDCAPVLVTDCDSSNRAAPSTIVEKYAVVVKQIEAGSPQPLPPALDQDLCEALSGEDAETKRKNVCGVLSSRACADGESTPCVVIASRITLTDGKITAVDVCSARPVVYSNPELFEMLLCRNAGTKVSYLRYESGDAQVAITNSAVPKPLVVQVIRNGSPSPNETVGFEVRQGGGLVGLVAGSLDTRVDVVSNADGFASLPIWQLGTAPGENLVLAKLIAEKLGDVQFRATAKPAVFPPVVTALEYLNVDGQVIATSLNAGNIIVLKRSVHPKGIRVTFSKEINPSTVSTLDQTMEEDASGNLPFPIRTLLVNRLGSEEENILRAWIGGVVSVKGRIVERRFESCICPLALDV
jgi:hypothetical protein